MNKSILKGILFTLGILSLFGIVFAIGFHTPNEILGGTFTGNYTFNGNIKKLCPTGFTSIESKGKQLGCIQNDENVATTYYEASNNCWENYGGRLPTTEEWYLGTKYYTLNNEIDNWERNSESYGSVGGTNRHAISGDGNIEKTNWALDSGNYAYRCFIPN